MYSVVHEKEQGLVPKLDYDKAFDKVSLDFLLDLLKKRSVGPKALAWFKAVTHGGSVGVKLNSVIGIFFLTGK
jgi:hypothetical protein